MELAAGAGRGREQDLLRRRRRGEHRRDRRPQLVPDPARLVHDQHRRTVVTQRKAAQHSRAIARQAHRQSARDEFDLGHGLAPEAASEAMMWRASMRNRKPDWRSDGETTTATPPLS